MNLNIFFNLLILVFDISNITSGAEDNNSQTRCKQSSDSDYEVFSSGANDVVVVQDPQTGKLQSTDFLVQVGKFHNWRTLIRSREGRKVEVEINGIESRVKMTIQDSGMVCFTRVNHRYKFSSEELQRFNLKFGLNRGSYRVPSLKIEIPFIVYLLNPDTKLVISDIDGTITEGDLSGRVFPSLGFKMNHDGIVKLLDKIVENGYVVVYLTARSMGEDGITRSYLFETLDDTDGGHSLPFGPLFMAPESIAESAVSHLAGKAHVEKVRTLKKLLELFPLGSGAVEGAFGNAETDRMAYNIVNIAPDRTYIINEDGQVKNVADDSVSTYEKLAEKVDDVFPLLN